MIFEDMAVRSYSWYTFGRKTSGDILIEQTPNTTVK